jgi:hypothetical protein
MVAKFKLKYRKNNRRDAEALKRYKLRTGAGPKRNHDLSNQNNKLKIITKPRLLLQPFEA